jgi:flagellar protein FlaG
MISQVANAVNLPQASAGQSAPVVEIKPQKTSAPVELPRQAVQTVEKVDVATVKAAAEQINKLVQQFDRHLQFTVDEETDTHVVKVIDTQSKEVIRQMPTEEMLAIAKALDKLQGLLIKDKV